MAKLTRYITAAAVTLTAGVVGLSEAQHRARAHCVKPVKGERGSFEIVNAINFKVGEEIGYSGPVGRDLAHVLVDPAEARRQAEETAALAVRANDVQAQRKAELDAATGALEAAFRKKADALRAAFADGQDLGEKFNEASAAAAGEPDAGKQKDLQAAADRLESLLVTTQERFSKLLGEL